METPATAGSPLRSWEGSGRGAGVAGDAAVWASAVRGWDASGGGGEVATVGEMDCWRRRSRGTSKEH